MIAFQCSIPRQEPVCSHRELLVAQLHDKRRSQVQQIRIACIGKKDIGKPIPVLFPYCFELRFPEKINEQRKPARCIVPEIPAGKMISMDKFYMPHSIKIPFRLFRWKACLLYF